MKPLARPQAQITITLPVADIIAYYGAGMLPNGASSAIARALEKSRGTLEHHEWRCELEAFRREEDRRDAERKRR